MKKVTKHYDVVVVGGGLSGVCAAIASARNGKQTALLQNRSVLGGNASSEIRVNINGALRNSATFKKDVGEGGILMEILLENKMRNPQHSFHVLDHILWEKVNFQENLTLYLNTSFFCAQTRDDCITSIMALQTTTETEFEFVAAYYIDTTGDASLAQQSGAQWALGREAKAKYQEAHAPEIEDHHTMGSTIMFSTKDLGRKVPFQKPEWAYTFTKETLGNRAINTLEFGYWWVELGGDTLRVVEDGEEIHQELLKWVFAVFDYIKNSGEFDADNLAIDWIASLPGRRESRRIIGDYVMRESDCYEGRRFADAVAYGGWTMDDHSVGGIYAMGKNQEGTQWLPIKDIYTIPYRSLYSVNINNLLVGGRAISVSHMAMTSTRVMATCAMVGQAAGTAAALCCKMGCSPRALGATHIQLLQQTLIKDDCYLPGIETCDAADLCANGGCEICVSGAAQGAGADKLVNGWGRNVEGVSNAWVSQPMAEQKAWVSLNLPSARQLAELQLRFDPDFNAILITTPMQSIRNQQPKELPPVLVRDFTVTCFCGAVAHTTIVITENKKRYCSVDLTQVPPCDSIKIEINKTYGDPSARVFEVRLYAEA